MIDLILKALAFVWSMAVVFWIVGIPMLLVWAARAGVAMPWDVTP